MSLQTKEINGHKVQADISENEIFFSVYLNNKKPKTGDTKLFGFIRTDGSSNWHLPGSQEEQIIFKEAKDALDLSIMLCKLYEWADELFPHDELYKIKMNKYKELKGMLC